MRNKLLLLSLAAWACLAHDFPGAQNWYNADPMVRYEDGRFVVQNLNLIQPPHLRSRLNSNPLFPSGIGQFPANIVSEGFLGGTIVGGIVDLPQFSKFTLFGRISDFAQAVIPYDPATGAAQGTGNVTTHGGTFPAAFTVDQKKLTIGAIYTDPNAGAPQNYSGTYSITNPIFGFFGTQQIPGADPIATGTGEALQMPPPDLVLNGPYPIVFTRHYGSYLAYLGFATSLGNNWLHSFGSRLYTKNGYVSVVLPLGINVYFKQSGGGYQPASALNYPAQLVSTPTGFRFLDPSINRIYTYDTNGRFVRVEDRNGNGLDIQQSSLGPTLVTDNVGRQLVFNYTGSALSSVRDGSGRTLQFTQDGSGNLTKFTDADGKSTAYSYTNGTYFNSMLTGVTSPRGNKILNISYDSLGRVLRQTDSQGHATTVSFDSSGSTSIKDPVGDSVAHQYGKDPTVLAGIVDGLKNATAFTRDAVGRVTSITGRNGGKTAVTYDPASGYIASVTDPEGNSTRFTYLAQSQDSFTYYVPSKITYPDTTTESWTYDPKGNALTFTDRAGNVTTFTYNQRGQVLTITNPAGGITTITYGTDGSLRSVKAPSGDTTSYSYDAQFRVKQITFADGSTRTFTYDNRDNVIKTVDELGQITTATFDDDNHLASTTGPSGTSTTRSYDSDDNLVKITRGNGASTTYTYNDASDLIGISNGPNDSQTLTYDADKRVTAIKDASGLSVLFGFDKEGGLTSVTDPMNRTVAFARNKNDLVTRVTTPAGENTDFTLDSMGRPTGVKNPLGASTTFSYDPLGLLTGIALPAGVSAGFGHDALGVLNLVTDGNGSGWSFSNDSQGRLAAQTDPLGRAVTYQYGQRGLLSGATTPEGSFTITRDAAGRATQQAYSDGTTLAVIRDAQGRITSGGNFSLSYTGRGQITGSNGLAITYGPGGRIASIAYTPDKKVTYTYNARGLLDSLADWAGGAISFAYNDAGQPVSATRSNGVVTQYSYDANGRLSGIVESGGGSTIASTKLTRDAAGQIIATDQSVPQANDPQPGVLQLGFDAAEQVSGFTYDGLGRVTADALRSYTWDLASRLTSYAGADGSASATYNDLGLRVSRTDASGNALQYIWNYATTLPSVSTIQSGGADLRYYVYLPDGSLLYSIEAADNSRHFYHFDPSGSTLLLTDDGANVTDTYAITPYGESVAHTGNTDNPFTWLGQLGAMQEGATSLFYLRARYYDSATGRFLSRDRILSADPRAVNPYQYAAGNPVSGHDASGLEPLIAIDPLTGRPFIGTDFRGNPGCSSFLICNPEPGSEESVSRSFAVFSQEFMSSSCGGPPVVPGGIVDRFRLIVTVEGANDGGRGPLPDLIGFPRPVGVDRPPERFQKTFFVTTQLGSAAVHFGVGF